MGAYDLFRFSVEKTGSSPFYSYEKPNGKFLRFDTNMISDISDSRELIDDIIIKKVAFDIDGSLVYIDGVKNTAKNPITVADFMEYVILYIASSEPAVKHNPENLANVRKKMMKIRNKCEVNP